MGSSAGGVSFGYLDIGGVEGFAFLSSMRVIGFCADGFGFMSKLHKFGPGHFLMFFVIPTNFNVDGTIGNEFQ